MLRSLIAVLLLVGYLLVAGVGGMNRPEDQHERVLVQTSANDQYVTQCRYLRMDGLESFLIEALATRYQQADDANTHQSISVVFGIDAHCLPAVIFFSFIPSRQSPHLTIPYRMVALTAPYRAIDAPPWTV